jgi:hypothetical protein
MRQSRLGCGVYAAFDHHVVAWRWRGLGNAPITNRMLAVRLARSPVAQLHRLIPASLGWAVQQNKVKQLRSKALSRPRW